MKQNKVLKEKRIVNLIRDSVRFNKKSIRMPVATWELIETILEKIKLEVNL